MRQKLLDHNGKISRPVKKAQSNKVADDTQVQNSEEENSEEDDFEGVEQGKVLRK